MNITKQERDCYENGPEGMPRVERMTRDTIMAVLSQKNVPTIYVSQEEDYNSLCKFAHAVAEETLARVPAWPKHSLSAQDEVLTDGQRENAEFHKWWESSGQKADHDLRTENAAHATWQERARRRPNADLSGLERHGLVDYPGSATRIEPSKNGAWVRLKDVEELLAAAAPSPAVAVGPAESIGAAPPLPIEMDTAEKISLSTVDCPELLEKLGAYAAAPNLDTAWAVLQCADHRLHHIISRRFEIARGEPIAYLRFRAAQQWSGVGGHDIEHNEWFETCHAHEIGDDKQPAFPVYSATPSPSLAVRDVVDARDADQDALDAERYRWLTHAGWIDDAIMEQHGIREGISETLDAAIDAAMREQP